MTPPEIQRIREIDVHELAEAIREVGFECTECGECCTSDSPKEENENVVTIFPDEVRRISESYDLERHEVAEPMPFGLDDYETFEWSVKREPCGDCFFHDSDIGCEIYEERPWICRTYPFDISLDSGEIDLSSVPATGVERSELDDCDLLVYECEGVGREMSYEKAVEYARRLKKRKIKEVRESRSLLENYEKVEPTQGSVVVHDSEGAHIVEERENPENGDS